MSEEREVLRLLRDGSPAAAAELLETRLAGEADPDLAWLAVRAWLLAGRIDRALAVLQGPGRALLGASGELLAEALGDGPATLEPGHLAPPLAADLLANRTLRALRDGQLEEARRLAGAAIEAIETAGLRDPSGLLAAGRTLLAAGEPEEAEELFGRAEAAAREWALGRAASEALSGRVRALLTLGRPAGALSAAAELDAGAAHHPSAPLRLVALQTQAEVALHLGDLDETRSLLAEVERIAVLLGPEAGERWPHLPAWLDYAAGGRPAETDSDPGRVFALAADLRSDPESAAAQLDLAELAASAEKRGDRPLQALALYFLATAEARAVRRRGRAPAGRALAGLDRAMRAARRAGRAELGWRLRWHRARLLAAAGRAGEAMADWRAVRTGIAAASLGLEPAAAARYLAGWGRSIILAQAVRESGAEPWPATAAPAVPLAAPTAPDPVPPAARPFPERSERRLRIVLETARELLAAETIEELAHRLAARVAALTGAERVAVLAELDGGVLEPLASVGLAAGPAGAGGPGWCRGAVEQARTGQQPVFTTDAPADPDLGGRASVAEMALRTVIVAPILRPFEPARPASETDPGGGRLLGFVYADDRSSLARLEPADAAVVEALARFAGLAWGSLLLRAAAEHETRRLRRTAAPRFPGLVGEGAAMQALARTLERAAPSELPVLIVGETGTGKDLVARLVHDHSRRAAGPFVYLSCAALPRGLLEAELFGIEKGVATGVDRRIGLLEQAGGGTLYLDEITGIEPEVQAKLLRFLQEMRFERVGGSQPVPVDVRVVASASADLEEKIARSAFREDLFYRLNGVRIDLPPLRTRLEDIPALAGELLARLAAETGREPARLRPDALSAMRRHDWPGNVRELANVLRKAALLGRRAGEISAADLEIAARPLPPPRRLADAIEELERRRVGEALARRRGSVSRAAPDLGLPRMALQRLVARLGIDRRVYRGRRS